MIQPSWTNCTTLLVTDYLLLYSLQQNVCILIQIRLFVPSWLPSNSFAFFRVTSVSVTKSLFPKGHLVKKKQLASALLGAVWHGCYSVGIAHASLCQILHQDASLALPFIEWIYLTVECLVSGKLVTQRLLKKKNTVCSIECTRKCVR